MVYKPAWNVYCIGEYVFILFTQNYFIYPKQVIKKRIL
ncbi:putative membrane protein [Moraxella catarrhalis]|nr:putative membrane protein [Moraxella catarrhalis]